MEESVNRKWRVTGKNRVIFGLKSSFYIESANMVSNVEVLFFDRAVLRKERKYVLGCLLPSMRWRAFIINCKFTSLKYFEQLFFSQYHI